MKDVNATVIIDIKNKTEEDIWKSVEYSRRKNIGKAKRNGLYIEKTNSKEDYEKCYNMYAQTIRDGKSTPFSYEVWKKWADEEKWDLFVIKKEKEKIGYFSVIKITRRYYGEDSDKIGIRPRVFASDKKYVDYRVNDLIYWGTILHGLKQGVDFVDLGGYQIKPKGHLKGVNSFKEKWGGEVFKYYLDYPFYVAIARKLIRNIGILWHLNEFLKKFKQKPPKHFELT
ncbi:MAG: peptidoglycan bridge formation glycyltransferase FemA/FemB family protein [Candidatus Pacearchaeota archaeon]|nr:peptidoglycan bridge formation glycyltransferase FemA/FemB family protein [Candidatus Pacearchaeota archaeon]